MMHKRPLLRFIVKSLLAAAPVLAVAALYLWRDPFGVVHPYERAFTVVDGVAVNKNAGFVAVESFKRHNARLHYNAFILGSSMSQYYRAQWWQRHLPPQASVCHLDASMETVEGLLNKMRFVNRHGARIEHALIVMEEEMLHREPSTTRLLWLQHPATTPQHDWLDFHNAFFNAFKQWPYFKFAIAPHRYAHELEQRGMMTGDIPARIEDINESYYPVLDSLIEHHPEQFFTPSKLAGMRHTELPQPIRPAIEGKRLRQLLALRALLERNRTSFIIIVPPRYHRPTLHPVDLAMLRQIFGVENVHDFSRDSALNDNPRLYYDQPAHLIASRCKLLLDSAYCEKTFIKAIKLGNFVNKR